MNLVKAILVLFYNFNKSRQFGGKINNIAGNLAISNQSFSKNLVRSHLQQWHKLKKRNNILWYKVFSHIRGKEDINYVPEDIYYTIIEPCLNNKQVCKAYSDKNIYGILFEKELFPKTILRNIDGHFYDEDYNRLNLSDFSFNTWGNEYPKIIIKPALDSGGGKSVELFTLSEGKYYSKYMQQLSIEWMHRKYKRNYLIQNTIEQHNFFRQFNEDSVNTVRVFTYRSVKDDKIIPLHTLLRIGKKGRYVDNQASGGISCGVNTDGVLNRFAIDKYGNKYFEINGVNFDKETVLPFFSQIIDKAINLASKNLHARLLGFDFCVDRDNNVKVIEINNLNHEINFYQMNNGSLFGNYTDEIIEYCALNWKSFVIDFDYQETDCILKQCLK